MDATQKHIRGSSVLLCGRLLAVGINFTGQVLLVRYLTTTDYGIWAYALSAVAVLGTFATLALEHAVDRFIPIYHERKQFGKMCGTLLFVAAAIFLTGTSIVAAVYFMPDVLSRWMTDPESRTLLFILVLAIPFDALDYLLIAAFASLARPSAIFFRRHLLGPGLKLVVTLLLIASHADVTFLAVGYVGASILSVLICVALLFHLLRKEGLLSELHLHDIEFPVREIFTFAAPLLASELAGSMMTYGGPIIIGFFHGPEQVALFRVVFPVAAMNYLVKYTFSLLYTAQTSRLFARNDLDGIRHIYWQNTVWMTVLTFPIFALTFGGAQSLTVFLYGQRYAASGMILAIMSLGCYSQVIFGFSQLTLKAVGKVRLIILTDLLGTATFFLLNLLLIPHYRALGAGVACAASLFAWSSYRQLALSNAAGLTLFTKDYGVFYLKLAGCTLALVLVQLWAPANIYVAVPIVSLISLCLLVLSRKQLQIKETFPELRKILRPIYGSQ